MIGICDFFINIQLFFKGYDSTRPASAENYISQRRYRLATIFIVECRDGGQNCSYGWLAPFEHRDLIYSSKVRVPSCQIVASR